MSRTWRTARAEYSIMIIRSLKKRYSRYPDLVLNRRKRWANHVMSRRRPKRFLPKTWRKRKPPREQKSSIRKVMIRCPESSGIRWNDRNLRRIRQKKIRIVNLTNEAGLRSLSQLFYGFHSSRKLELVIRTVLRMNTHYAAAQMYTWWGFCEWRTSVEWRILNCYLNKDEMMLRFLERCVWVRLP